MRHEFDQAQVQALGKAAREALSHAAGTVLTRWTRGRALSAAVAFHMETSGRRGSTYDVLGTARTFEKYIKDGKVNGND